MWKKKFVQINTLTSHIEKCENPLSLMTKPQPQYLNSDIEVPLNKKQSYFIEDDDEEEENWNPNLNSIKDWDTYKLSCYLATNPTKVPVLKKILRRQENAYHRNPSYLCEFKGNDGSIQLWINGTLLYNTPRYYKKYEQAVKKMKDK
tara:strand:- start:276 stop:716 length:441 start_codon:yes stop_codon:yes gene_type:complete